MTLNLPTTVSFSYDGNGNLTGDGNRVFEYDYENQLTNVYVASAWRSEFKYDGFGRRRVRKEYTWQSSTWLLTNEVRYVYDGMLVVQERDANNLPQVSYTRGNDLSGSLQGAGGIGGLLARTANPQFQLPSSAGSAHAYYHADANGNITALVNTNGVLLARYQYDPYGNLLGSSGPLAEANTYRFSSKEYQVNSALYYYGYRFYEPNQQRWLNRDPIEDHAFALLKKQIKFCDYKIDFNLYVLNFNNAIGNYDAFGLSPCTDRCDREARNRNETVDDAAVVMGVGGAVFGGALGFVSGARDGQAISRAVQGAVVFAGVDYIMTEVLGTAYNVARYTACMAGCALFSPTPPPPLLPPPGSGCSTCTVNTPATNP